MNVLGIGLDYLMLKNDKIRGDVRARQFDYASHLNSLYLVIYSPKRLVFKAEKWSKNLSVYPTNSKNKATFILDALRIASKICRNARIDLITAEDPFIAGLAGVLLKRKFKIPLNIQSHVDFCDNKYWMDQRKINKIFNRLGKFVLKRADSVRVGTEYEKDKISKTLGIKKEKISVIPVNSELSKFKNVNGVAARQSYLKGYFDKILLFSGRLVPQKDIPTLLKAFQIIKQVRPSTLLLVVGSGIQESDLKNMANELGISKNIVFTGSIEHNKIPEYLAACDVYTISSIFEGTCIAMAEAMASGKPVVATRFAGAMDLIVDGITGFSVKQGDYRTFANNVLYLLNNPEISEKIGQNAAKKAEDIFSDNQNIDKVIKMWEQIAKC